MARRGKAVNGRHSNENPSDKGGDHAAERPTRPSDDAQDWFTPRRNATPPYDPPPADDDGASDWFGPLSPHYPGQPRRQDPGGGPGPGGPGPGGPGPGGPGPGGPGPGGPGDPGGPGGPPPGAYRPSGFTGASDPGGYNPGFTGASDPGGYQSRGFTGASDPGGYYSGSYRSYAPPVAPAGSGPVAPPYETTDPYRSGRTGGSGGPGGSGGFGDFDDEYGGGLGGEGAARRREARRRRSLSALIGPLAGAVGLTILLGVGVYALADSGAGCSGGDATTLNVAAAPDIAPVVSDVVGKFNDERHSAGGHCVKGIVKPVEPSSVANLLSGQSSGNGAARPDVWIPDSTLWPTVVQSSAPGADAVQLSPTRLAESPLVVAMPRSLAAKLKSQGTIANPSWDNLLSAAGAFAGGAVTKNQTIPANEVRIQILDPQLNSSGMEALVLTRLLLTNDPHADTIFAAIVRSVRDQTSPNVRSLFGSFQRDGAGRYPILLTSEQSVWKYNQGHPSDPAVAVYPSEGTMIMEYPFAFTTRDGRKLQAANALEQAFGSDDAKNAVQALGFRTPDGAAGKKLGPDSGLSPRRPRPLPAPSSADVQTALSAWEKLTLGTRMLSLIDISGSMAAKVPGTNVTRMQGILQVIQGGLSLYPDDTEIGQWLFSTNLAGKRDWLETVPIGPLGERIGSFTRRKQLLASNARIRPKPNGNTGLNDSVLAAYRKMEATYEPDKYNFVIVFTDGKNDDPGGGISDKALFDTLRKSYNPDKPVQVIMIGFGNGVDRAAMDRIATATNGVSFVASRPQDVAKFFLEAIARRVCEPHCPGG
jgi:Bacterial extracellular solute-binding protein/von Willebrand factor type A domain